MRINCGCRRAHSENRWGGENVVFVRSHCRLGVEVRNIDPVRPGIANAMRRKREDELASGNLAVRYQEVAEDRPRER